VAWLSYDDDNNWVYFDDFKITHTKTNVVQYNEYYPFGLTTANSWTRENNVGNNFLGNGGTELNSTTALYDLHYRNYDPVLGRMNQVDPLASKYAATTPYNFAFNDPANYNDPLGDDPGSSAHCSWCYTKPRPIDTGNGSGGGSGEGGGNPFAGLMGRSAGFFDPGWQPGSGSLSAGAFASMDARYNAYNIARGNVNALRSGTYTNDGNGGFIYSPVVTGSANVPIAQVSFVLGQNGHYMGYKLLIGPKLKILYVDRDISVVQGKDGGWESVGTTTMFDLEDNTSFSYGSAVALAQGNMAYTSSGTENSGWGFEFYNGIPIVTSPWVERGAAFTPGPFIIKHPSINPHTDRRDQQLIRHEIGHVINFLMTPALYIPVIAIPSVINFQTGLGGDHDSFYTEKIANTLSEWFFGPFDNPNKYPSYNKK
jgi:RHS repeat-associated protein